MNRYPIEDIILQPDAYENQSLKLVFNDNEINIFIAQITIEINGALEPFLQLWFSAGAKQLFFVFNAPGNDIYLYSYEGSLYAGNSVDTMLSPYSSEDDTPTRVLYNTPIYLYPKGSSTVINNDYSLSCANAFIRLNDFSIFQQMEYLTPVLVFDLHFKRLQPKANTDAQYALLANFDQLQNFLATEENIIVNDEIIT
jgi:hypothetical protein